MLASVALGTMAYAGSGIELSGNVGASLPTGIQNRIFDPSFGARIGATAPIHDVLRWRLDLSLDRFTLSSDSARLCAAAAIRCATSSVFGASIGLEVSSRGERWRPYAFGLVGLDHLNEYPVRWRIAHTCQSCTTDTQLGFGFGVGARRWHGDNWGIGLEVSMHSTRKAVGDGDRGNAPVWGWSIQPRIGVQFRP